MPTRKKGFAKGALNHTNRSLARDGRVSSREAVGAAVQEIGQLMADGTYSAADGLHQLRTLLARQEGLVDGAEAAAGDGGGSAKRSRDGDSAVAGPAGQRCALPSCGVLLYNAQAVALDGESIDAVPLASCGVVCGYLCPRFCCNARAPNCAVRRHNNHFEASRPRSCCARGASPRQYLSRPHVSSVPMNVFFLYCNVNI
jgi:hypothetical protein